MQHNVIEIPPNCKPRPLSGNPNYTTCDVSHLDFLLNLLLDRLGLLLDIAAVHSAEVAVPQNREAIDEQNPVMQWDKLEVDELKEWPHRPICRQGWPVCRFQLGLRTCTLHERHTVEEEEEVGGGEKRLITGNPGEDLGVLVSEDHFVL